VKRTVVIAVLAFAAIWPLAHRAMVTRYDLNPWKFAAWAMYTTPTPPVIVALFTKQGGGFVVVDEAGFSPHVRALLTEFRRERHALGKLRKPDRLARAALRARPDLSSIVVVVQKMTLDRSTALMTSSREIYDYDRVASLR